MRRVRHPDRAEVRRDAGGAETVVKHGLDDGDAGFDVVVHREGKMGDGHAVMSVMLRMDSSEAFKVVKGLVDGLHEMAENPVALGGVEILGFDEVEFRKGCKLGPHPSERGAAGFETGADLVPVVNGNLARLIERFAAGEFLSVPGGRREAAVGGLELRPEIIHRLDFLLGAHAVYGFHYGWHRCTSKFDAAIIPYGGVIVRNKKRQVGCGR